MRKLKVLRLDNNHLSKIDYREIGCCSQLTVLDISCNDIQDISVSLNLLEKGTIINQSRSCRNNLLSLFITVFWHKIQVDIMVRMLASIIMSRL